MGRMSRMRGCGAWRVAVGLALVMAPVVSQETVGQSSAAPNLSHAAAKPDPLALPQQAEGDGPAEEEAQLINVGGSMVKLDKLGPMIVNADGTISRITNWDTMTAREQQVALKRIAKRNEQRREKLLTEISSQGGSGEEL